MHVFILWSHVWTTVASFLENPNININTVLLENLLKSWHLVFHVMGNLSSLGSTFASCSSKSQVLPTEQKNQATKCNCSLNQWRKASRRWAVRAERGAWRHSLCEFVSRPDAAEKKEWPAGGEEGQSTSSDSQRNCAKPTYTGVRLAHDSVGSCRWPQDKTSYSPDAHHPDSLASSFPLFAKKKKEKKRKSYQ